MKETVKNHVRRAPGPIVYKNYSEAEVKERQRLAREENAEALESFGPVFVRFVKAATDFKSGASKTAKRRRRESCFAAMAMQDAMPWLSWAALSERQYQRYQVQRRNAERFLLLESGALPRN